MQKRIMVIFGTRPECIKLAPVIAEMDRRSTEFSVTLCSSGQHNHMLRQALLSFDLKADIELSVMRPNQTLPELTAALMLSLTRAIECTRPDWILVQGDTTTAFVAALAGFYSHVRIGHVEAGLRSGDRFNPFPEEVNRQLISKLADLHFAPTKASAAALAAEGISHEKIYITGNTIVDALNHLKAQVVRAEATLAAAEKAEKSGMSGIVLITCHRRESFGADLAAICHAIAKVAVKHPNRRFVFPVHMNPNVRGQVHEILDGISNVDLLEPLPYAEFIRLMSRADLIMSDSGGVQEEAPSFGVPVLVLRRTTERSEGIDAGFAELVGPDEAKIVRRANEILSGAWTRVPAGRQNPYGDGHAAERIVAILSKADDQNSNRGASGSAGDRSWEALPSLA